MKMRTLIIEDEEPARLGLRQMLIHFPVIEIIDIAIDGIEALEKIQRLQPDLIFLDIQIPELNGFEVLRSLKSQKLPLIIFTTAFEKYAIQAFEVNAIDYLLKPYSEVRLGQAIHRARKLLNQKRAFRHQIKQLIDSFANLEQAPLNKVPLYKGERIVIIDVNQIVWIKLETNIVQLKVNEEVNNTNISLGEFERRLNPRQFLRVNRNTLVNLSKVKEILPWFNRSYRLVMNDKARSEIDVSRRRAKAIKTYFNL